MDRKRSVPFIAAALLFLLPYGTPVYAHGGPFRSHAEREAHLKAHRGEFRQCENAAWQAGAACLEIRESLAAHALDHSAHGHAQRGSGDAIRGNDAPRIPRTGLKPAA
jgi:hypothetical protein